MPRGKRVSKSTRGGGKRSRTNNNNVSDAVNVDVDFRPESGETEVVQFPQPPPLVSCPTMEAPENGEVVVSSNGSVTIATYSCETDYSLYGNTVLSCISGTWEGTAPTCVCSTFLEPSDGNIEISENGTKATYSCDAGFTLSGDLQQTCGVVTAVGDTTLSAPSCVACETLTASSGAVFELSTDGSETIATFQCPAGYTMVGTSNLTCRTDGSWDTSAPSCETCDTLGAVSGGSVSFITDGQQSQAVFTCDEGSTMSGPSTLTCRTDGTWDIVQPNCVTCPTLSDPENGQVNVSTSGEISVAKYTCTAEYFVYGNDTLTCLESGKWDHDIPVCRCLPPESPLNGTVLISDDGDSAQYTCNVGYNLNGDAVRTCQTDGTGWHGTQPTCVQCEALSTTSYLSYDMSSDGTTTTVEFTCNTGSSMDGENILSCLPDGSWSNQFPICVNCPSITSDSDSLLSYESNGTVTTTIFQCSEGSALVGNSRVSCQTDGTWSDSKPTCVQCPVLDTQYNGAVVLSVNASTTWASFTCNDGYSVSDTSDIYCTTLGEWNTIVPVCECDSFTKPVNGHIVVSANNSVSTVTCDKGFTLSGETAQYCSSSSVSVDASSKPSCVSCASLSTPSGSSVLLSTDGVNTFAIFSCDTGHVMNGESVLTCRSDGTWNLQTPSCSVCEPLDAPAGGSVLLTSDGENTTAVYTCVTGFTLIGQSVLSCKSDGSWDFIQPTCECDKPVSLDNGAMEISNDTLTATYSCDVGYSLLGSDTRHCRTNGSWWDGTDPVCNECSSLVAGNGMNITLHGDGKTTSAVFMCETGYSLSHTNNVTCLSDGSWNTAAPSCVQCETLNSTTALSFSFDSNGKLTTAKFVCAAGYGMSGPESVTCSQNGSWTMSQPTCFKTSDYLGPQDSGDGGGTGAAIAFGILFGIATIAAIILAVIAWRMWKKYKSVSGAKAGSYLQDAKLTSLFDEFDRDKITPSRAPLGHQRHVTDMGRADSSLAPRGHHKHVTETGEKMSSYSPAPLTTRNIELQKPPMMIGRRSPTMFSSLSATPASLKSTSLDPFLPEQIGSPRNTSSAASSILDVPKIHIEEPKPKRVIKKPRPHDAEPKSGKLSPFMPIKEKHEYREGSPLPQQILTPRNADDIAREIQQTKMGTDDRPKRKREKKPKGDLIDKDKNLLKIYSGRDGNSPTPGTSSPQYQKLAGYEQDHEISDIEV